MNRKKRSVAQRALQQCLRRLPVGHSVIYLNELSAHNQLSFLTQCFGQGSGSECGGDAGCLGDIHIGFEGSTFHPPPRPMQQQTLAEAGKESRPPRHVTTPLSGGVVSRLLLPKMTCGQLSAYRAPHLDLLPRPQLFLLLVPRRLFTSVGSCFSTEALLRRHLVDVRGVLHWREHVRTLPNADTTGHRRETESGSVMLLPTWGCSAAQARQAVAMAAIGDFRVFLLGRGRQRLLSSQALSVQELGRWCPAAFRSFQLDILSVEQTPVSSRSFTLSLLDEARRGFREWGRSVNKLVDGSDSLKEGKRDTGRGKCAISLSVAEAVLDVRCDAAVPWASVADSYLSAKLFEALHDRRHWCALDAMIHASQYVVLPFLVGELSANGTYGANEKCCSSKLTRLLRWSDLQSMFRWRHFEPVFGPLSQLVRPEDVTAIGGGRDPFILPLHDTFVRLFLLPRMRIYYAERHSAARGTFGHLASHNKGDRAREPKVGMEGGGGEEEATVDILDCFNELTREVGMNRACDSLSRGCGKGVDRLSMPKEERPGTSRVPSFTVMDLPALVKYLFYFPECFEVSRSGMDVTFRLRGS